MKILHVISSVDPASGGPIEFVVQIGQALARDEHQNEVVSLDTNGAPWIEDCPLKVHAVGQGGGTYSYSSLLVPWLREHHGDYDAVIVHGLWQYASFAAWRALHATNTPYFVFPHGMLDPWFKQAFPLKHLKKRLYWPAEYRVLRDAKAVCFTCEEEKILAPRSFRPYLVTERVVNFGTKAPTGDAIQQREMFLAQFPALRDKRILLFLSRIHLKKGCDLLIEAFAGIAAESPELHLVMAGPDPTNWRPELEQLAEKLGVAARITWSGMLRDDLKWGAYHAAEVFVLPSHQENFGIVVAEALACGLPVLISNKVNIWREIEGSGAGFAAEDTVPGTVKLLQTWLKTTPQSRQQMSTQAVACFEEHFEIGQAAQSLANVLKSFAKE